MSEETSGMPDDTCCSECFWQGKKQERERIIALLEAWVADDNGNFDATLALIKGENE